ncbi:MAG: hypothetical protein H0W90_07135 [Actinobacteria bacterium]|nr:hypothetical protein [Actinomycetota bacterium]
MPNWCHNVLTVTGSAAEISAFVERARPTLELKRKEYEETAAQSKTKPPLDQWFRENYGSQPLTFQAFVPQPPEVSDWYSWRCEHWGTKWDASFDNPGIALAAEDSTADLDASLQANGLLRTPTVLVYRFETAWTPPTEAVVAMAAQHPELEFRLRYGQPGEGFAGEATFSDRKLQQDIELEVEDVLAPEEMWF